MRIAQVLGERPVAVVADREVQLAVRSEPDAPADVQQLGRRRRPEQLERTVRADVVGRAEPDQVVQQVVPGVIEVDVVVGHAEVGVERDADQAAVAGVLRRQVGERGRQQLPVLHDLDLPAALEDEDPAVRRDLETRRAVQAVADHQRGLEVGWRRGGCRRGGPHRHRQQHEDREEARQPPPPGTGRTIPASPATIERSIAEVVHRHLSRRHRSTDRHGCAGRGALARYQPVGASELPRTDPGVHEPAGRGTGGPVPEQAARELAPQHR